MSSVYISRIALRDSLEQRQILFLLSLYLSTPSLALTRSDSLARTSSSLFSPFFLTPTYITVQQHPLFITGGGKSL